MRAMRAEGFSGYRDLKLADIPKPQGSEGRVLVKIAAAGVTPLEHTILSGGYPRAKAPLVLGSEGAGVVEDANGSDFSVGARVMFTGSYGVSEDGAYSEYLAVRNENLSLIPGNIDDVSAAGLPVAYLTAHMALSLAGFQAGKTVLSPAIGGSVGNAVTQLARALGARHAMSTTTSHAKAEQAKTLGFDEVIDLSAGRLGEGVRRITEGYGSDIVIDAIGGDVLSEALGTLAMGGSLTTLGYAAGRKSTIDVTDLIWNRASIKSFSLLHNLPRCGGQPGKRFVRFSNPEESNRSWHGRSLLRMQQKRFDTRSKAGPSGGSCSRCDSDLERHAESHSRPLTWWQSYGPNYRKPSVLHAVVPQFRSRSYSRVQRRQCVLPGVRRRMYRSCP
jgi:NADPH:quinone reductase